MNPVIEQWFEELDEGGDDLRGFIRQTSDVVLSEMGVPPQLVKYLQDRNLALVPMSRLWWENPPDKLFAAVRPRYLTPPGREDAPEEGLPPGGEVDTDEIEGVHDIRGSFVQGALEGIVVGQPVVYMTEPTGPMRQQDTGVGVVERIHGTIVTIKSQEGRQIVVDMGAGGRVTLRR